MSLRAFSLAAAVVLSLQGVEATAQGALKLDNYTLDKVTSIPGWSFLVKFDQSYAYGEKEDEFKLLAKHAHAAQNFMVAEVPVQEYGDKENDDLRERFKLVKDEFPAYIFFKAGEEAGRYSGSIKADLLITWLRRQGVKIASIGTIEELDVLAEKFMQDPSDSVVAEAKTLADGEFKEDRKAAVYVKIMQKILEKGKDYPATEAKRVTKIAEGKLAPEKKAELEEKIKILGVFTERSKDEL